MPFTVQELDAAIRTANEHFRGVMQTEEQLLKDRLMFGISLYRFDEAGAKVRIDPRGIETQPVSQADFKLAALRALKKPSRKSRRKT
jgi:hypothetical protein